MRKLLKFSMILLSVLSESISAATTIMPDYSIKDVQGNSHTLSSQSEKTAAVYVMLGTDCVISRRIISELNTLARFADKNEIGFFGVLADEWTGASEGKEFQKDYEIEFPLLLDQELLLASQLKPRVRPEAFVFNQDDTLVYRGRVDNRFEELGVLRNLVTKHELKDALVAVSEQRFPKIKETMAIGCVYKPWPKQNNNETREYYDE
jgi:peroxiredoxin